MDISRSGFGYGSAQRESTAGLTPAHSTPDKVVIGQHPLHTEGQGDRDGQGQALGHCDYQDGHARDEIVQVALSGAK